VLERWRETLLFEALEWDTGWTDSGRVFTREDGARCGRAYQRASGGADQPGRPAARAASDLRHGAASMLVAAGQPVKVVSEIMGHATSSLTNDVCVTVAEELNEAAAVAIAAYIPRRAINVPAEER
jgi:integrase